MVTFPPYLSDAGWYGNWLRNLAAFLNDRKAVSNANAGMNNPKLFTRAIFYTPTGREILLSIPIEGGGRQSRNFLNLENLRLSGHGNWRKSHLKAIEAVFGRYPFFSHIFDLISQIYENTEIQTLKDFNLSFHNSIKDFLLSGLSQEEINLLPRNHVLLERGKELAREFAANKSMLYPLMQYGKEAIPAILAL